MTHAGGTRPRWTERAAPAADDRPLTGRSRAVGEAVVIPTPRQLHPERYVPGGVPIPVGDPPGRPVLPRARAPEPVRGRAAPAAPASNELNWRLILVAAVPILAGLGLLALGLGPDAIVLSW